MSSSDGPELMSVAEARRILGEETFAAIRDAPKTPLRTEQVELLVRIFRGDPATPSVEPGAA